MRIALFRLPKEIGELFKLYDIHFYNVNINLHINFCAKYIAKYFIKIENFDAKYPTNDIIINLAIL